MKLITIDGPSASGKSTVSRLLAQKLTWSWVSTGLFYRGLAYAALHENVDPKDEAALVALTEKRNLWYVEMNPESTLAWYQGKDVTERVHGEQVGAMASQVSQLAGVRQALLQRQRDCYFGERGLIAEGRDCGTVVFPGAPLKIFLTADAKRRAQRRSIDENTNWRDTLELQKKRDQDDSGRKQAPLRPAEDAIELDSSERNLEEVVEMILQMVRDKGL